MPHHARVERQARLTISLTASHTAVAGRSEGKLHEERDLNGNRGFHLFCVGNAPDRNNFDIQV
jgi:hypothetical protein